MNLDDTNSNNRRSVRGSANGTGRRKQRGVGAVIGGVILAAILLTTVLVYFMTILNNEKSKASYEILSSQDSQDKAAENFLVTRDENLSGGNIRIHITNEGSLSTIISKILLYCISSAPGCDSPDPAIINPSSNPDEPSVTLNAGENHIQEIGPVNDGLTYRIDVISERGNIVSAVECTVDASAGICEADPSAGSPDFLLTVSPSTLVIERGSSATSMVTVTSLGGFSSPVALSTSPALTGVTTAFTPSSSVTPSSGDPASATLTITASSSAPAGTYSMTITGTSDTITRSQTIALTILEAECVECAVIDGIIQGTGSLQLDFKSFGAIYPNFAVRNGVDQTGWSVKAANATGYPASSVAKSNSVVLVERMRNFDSSGQAITLTRQTGLSITLGKAQGNTPTIIYICSETLPPSQGTTGSVAAYTTDTKVLPYTDPRTAGRYTGFQDVYFCAQDEQATTPLQVWNPTSETKFDNINGIFMVARGYFGATSNFYSQVVPYQSLYIANLANVCLKTQNAADSFACPASMNTAGTSANYKYSASASELRTGTGNTGPLTVKMRIEGTLHGKYSVDWVYPTSGRHVTLANGLTPVNNHISFQLPTTDEDGNPIAPGWYSLAVTSDYYKNQPSDKQWTADVAFMTFRVT